MLGLIAVVVSVAGILVAIGIPLEIERRKRPELRIVRSDDLDVARAYRIVHLRVTNEPIGGRIGKLLLRNVATGCRVDVTFRSRSGGKETNVPGRWSGHPQPLEKHLTWTGEFVVVYRQEAVPATLVFDLSPDPDGQNLGIAIKREGIRSAFAFTSESYEDPATMCLPRYELTDPEYDVTVRAHAGQVTRSANFVLRNEGSSYMGLSLAEVAPSGV